MNLKTTEHSTEVNYFKLLSQTSKNKTERRNVRHRGDIIAWITGVLWEFQGGRGEKRIESLFGEKNR